MFHLPDAAYFVIVGRSLRDEITEHELFNTYFNEKRRDQLKFIDDIHPFLSEQSDTTLNSTLFIVKYFDIDKNVTNMNNNNVPTEFSTLLARNCSVMGSIALLQLIRNLKTMDDAIKMVPNNRPLHNLAMQDIIITFSGISDKQEAQQLLNMTRYMGAKSRTDITDKTTHLVAANVRGLKYRRALELGLPIMDINWVLRSFELAQEDIDFKSSLPEFISQHRLKPFHGLRIAFVEFTDEDVNELSHLTTSNSGTVVDTTDPTCSHIVVDAISGFDYVNSRVRGNTCAHVVYKEWFWASLEIEGKANEETYSVPGTKSRRSSIMSPALDYSRSPNRMMPATPRHLACLELLQTERNYVKVLETIVNLFKLPLENSNPGDPVLPITDVKIIFGNITPIYEVHKKMLNQLVRLIEFDWDDKNCIGKVFMAHSLDLLKAYPPFVNFFEDTKRALESCDKNNPRFHAFLNRCQSRRECNRESLKEMLIRPVQRLPSISLLLKELLKRTEEANPDKKYLQEALESIQRVMSLINEDKRKTEGQIAMFDIVNDIEDCPPNLLSALRSFVCKVEARILCSGHDHGLSTRIHKVILFLFNDVIELCKVRSKRTRSLKGPVRDPDNKKMYRHLDELHLCDIMKVYKRQDSSGELKDAIVIQARPTPKYDQNFRYYPLVIFDESSNEKSFLENLKDLIDCDDPGLISDNEIDFGFANLLMRNMDKSCLSRVRSIKDTLMSPRIKSQRMLGW